MLSKQDTFSFLYSYAWCVGLMNSKYLQGTCFITLLHTTEPEEGAQSTCFVFIWASCKQQVVYFKASVKISVSFFRNSLYLLLSRLPVLSFSVYFLVFILLLLSTSSWDCKLSGAETVYFGLCLWSIQHGRVLVHDATWIQININNNHHHWIRAKQAIDSENILIIIVDNYDIEIL